MGILILQGPPEAFYMNVVQGSPYAGHTGLYAPVLQGIHPLIRGELTALVCVHNLRRTVPLQRLHERFQAELGIQRIGEPPAQDVARINIEDGNEVHMPAADLQVSDVRGPDLARSRGLKVTDQAGVFAMFFVSFAGAGFWVKRLQSRFLHASLNTLAIDEMPVAPQYRMDSAVSVKRVLLPDLTNEVHKLDGLF